MENSASEGTFFFFFSEMLSLLKWISKFSAISIEFLSAPFDGNSKIGTDTQRSYNKPGSLERQLLWKAHPMDVRCGVSCGDQLCVCEKLGSVHVMCGSPVGRHLPSLLRKGSTTLCLERGRWMGHSLRRASSERPSGGYQTNSQGAP